MKASRDLIVKHIWKYVLRKRLRKVFVAMITKLRAAVKRIKRVIRWRYRHKKIFEVVAQRIEKKKREAEEKRRREEEERRKKEEEARLKKEAEERKKREEELRLQ